MDELEELEFLNNQVFDDTGNESPKEISEDINSEVIESQENKNDKVIQKPKTKVIDTSKKTKATIQQVYQELQELKSLMISTEEISEKIATKIDGDKIITKISSLLAEKITPEKLSLTFLVGVLSILLAFIFGVSYGYIIAVAKYPYWMNKNIFYSLLNTPSGLMIFLIGGIFMFYIGKTYRIKILRLVSILVVIISFILPFVLVLK